MGSSEFARICKEMSQMSETVTIQTTKLNVKFSCSGDFASGSITLKAAEGGLVRLCGRTV